MTDDKKKPTAEEKHAANAIEVFRKGRQLGRATNCGLILAEDSVRGAIDGAWPGDNLSVDQRIERTRKLIGQAKIAIENSERPAALLECTGPSVLDTLTACASLDLSLNKALGEAYLVPFAKVCTLMIGFKGFIRLIVNAGFVTHVETVLVYEGEKFSWTRDEKGPHWDHEPSLVLQGQVDKVVGAYAVGYTRTGAAIFEPMNRKELEHVMGVSKMSGKGANKEWKDQMWRKATVRRLQKWLPKTGENLGAEILAKAIAVDNESFDVSRQQKFAGVENEYRQVRTAENKSDWDERMRLAKEFKDADAPSDPPESPVSPASAPISPETPSDAVSTVQGLQDAVLAWFAANLPDFPADMDTVYEIQAPLAVRATGKTDVDWGDPAPWTADVCGKCVADLAANGVDDDWLPKAGGAK